jgi:hypothetical protein
MLTGKYPSSLDLQAKSRVTMKNDISFLGKLHPVGSELHILLASLTVFYLIELIMS